MNDRLLDIEGIEIAYRRRGAWLPVVRNVDLRLAPGEAYGLVGESGCGKSTLALAVMRYLPPNARIGAGRVTFLGRDLYAMNAGELRELRGRRISMVYQNPGSALNPSLTIGTQVAEVFARHLGLDRRAAASAAVDMLARMRMSDPGRVARQYPFQLSGGMQQRAVLAMALATDPDLLVLDEPTTALDATVQAEILALFAELRRTSRTAMLFISHNLAVVRQVCDRVGVMYAGEIAEEGPAARVLDRPRHPYTAALLACLPRPGQRKGGRRLATLPGSPPDLGGLPPGCAFEPRCPSARPSCREAAPELAPDAPDTRVRCFFPVEGQARRAVPGPAAAGPRHAPQPVLAVRGLRQTLGATEILKGVDIEIHAGETFGLVGESGSGKTTLAKAVAGLAPASSGGIVLDGAELAPKVSRRDRAQRRAVQLVFQSPDTTLNPSWRVGTVLRRAARKLGGMSRAQAAERVRTLFDLVRLPGGLSASLPGRLSGGQRQRVAIARAFAGDPRLVILDEPTSALDVSVQAAILNLLLDLQRESGAAYLFISHDLAVVRYLADTVGVMFRGELVEVGPTERVFAPPHHPYTATLLDALPDLGGTRVPAAAGGRDDGAPAPGGCAFRNRCSLASDRCAQDAPPWRNAAAGHAIRCWVEPEVLAQPSHAGQPGDRRRADGAP